MRKILSTLIIAFSIIYVEAQAINLSVQQCREMALETSEDMKIAGLQNKQAQIEKQVAKTAYFPEISASATYAYINGGIELGMDDMNLSIPLPELGIEIDLSEMIPQSLMMDLNTDLYIIGANLQQPIFTGGKILTGNKMAQKGIEITEEFSAMTRMNVIAEAENAYWNYFLIGDKIELLKQYELLLDTLYQSVSDMISVQMATDSELLKITSRKSNIQYQMHKAKNGKELLRMQLCRIIGVDLNT